jgi:hypothetical protein
MKVSKVKYQIVLTRRSGTQIILGTYLEWDEAILKFRGFRLELESQNTDTIFADTDWYHLELQRVEVLEG